MNEREEENAKILKPHQLSPGLMRHACIAAVGYLTGSSIQSKEQMIATLREAVTTPCAGWETFQSLREELAALRQQLAEKTAHNETLVREHKAMAVEIVGLHAEMEQQLAEARAEVERVTKRLEECYQHDESACKSNSELLRWIGELKTQLAAQAAELERLRDAAEKSVTAFEHYQMTCREHRSPYIKENGRHGASPYAELVESCQDLRAALSPSDKENKS